MRLAVVKLGGSTADHGEMRVWVDALARSSLPLVIVPGGGPFADQVRKAQRHLGFSDIAAHAMAILAMEQFGYVILDRQDRLAPARSPDDMEEALKRGKVPVWLPSAMAIPAADIPPSWDITSDSLAAWLAGKIGAKDLLLIKQTGAFSDRDDLASLTARGIVDPALSTMLPAGIQLHLAGPDDAPAARELLSSGRLPGRRMRPAAIPMRESA